MNNRTESYGDSVDELRLPEGLAETGAGLLHQQCWCWGYDIRHPEGNLLLAFGFERERPLPPASGSSHYRKRLSQVTVHLWGFGVVWQDPLGACYVNRYRFGPVPVNLACLERPIWSPDGLVLLPPGSVPQTLLFEQLAAICCFIASYEDWIVRRLGLAHREAALQAWDSTAVEASRMADAWRHLASQILALV